MRATACLFAMVMGGGVAACDGLADDSNPGRQFGRFQGTITGEIPDGVNLELAIVWRGGPVDDAESCNEISDTEPIVQAVTWSVVASDRFLIELDGPPPSGAVHGPLDEEDDEGSDGSDGGGGGAIPAERAEGILVAYDDRDGDGQLDLCRDATCTDVVLGASNPGEPFLDRTVIHEDPEGEIGWSRLDEAYPENAMTLLYVEDSWKPYGVREIAAGYAVWRTEADVGAGERFLDSFDPTIDIEVPLVNSPVLDQLSCDGGCEVRFEYGTPECPDLETSWCTLRPELPPEGVRVGQTTGLGTCYTATGDCIAEWHRLTIEGCTRRLESWYSCPVPEDQLPMVDGMWNPDPDAWDWSCLEAP